MSTGYVDYCDLDETKMREELGRRAQARAAGLCDYCGKAAGAPMCKERRRHVAGLGQVVGTGDPVAVMLGFMGAPQAQQGPRPPRYLVQPSLQRQADLDQLLHQRLEVEGGPEITGRYVAALFAGLFKLGLLTDDDVGEIMRSAGD